MKKLHFLVIILLILNSSLHAQERGQLWTLQSCIEKATSNNLQILRSRKTAERSKYAVDKAYANFGPNVSATANHVYSYGRTVDPFTNVNLDRDQQTNNFGLNASIPVFQGLSNQYTLKRDKTLLEADLKDVEQARNEVILQITGAYLETLLSYELLQNARLQLASSTTQLERNKKLLDAGSIPQATFLEFKSQVATDELNVIQAENSLELAKLNLQQLMQLPYSDDFEIYRPEIDEKTLEMPPLPSQQIYESALLTQPNIQSASMRIDAAEFNKKVASGNRYPSLFLFGNMRTNYASSIDSLFSFGEQIENNFGQSFGFSLNIPIFTQFQNKLAVQNARIEQELAQINLKENKNVLRQDVEQAYLDAKAAAKSYESIQNQAEALRETFRSVEQRKNLNAASAFEYEIARNNLNTALSDLIRSKYEYIFRLKILDFYLGNPITL